MRVPLKWLAEFVTITLPLDDLAWRLTAAGLEVDKVEEFGGDWDRELVLVGEVTAVRRHPNADRLTLATVAYGGGRSIELVTGAPNITVGMAGEKVPLALAGARLVDAYTPGGGLKVLEPAKIRGVRSAGMVCSEKELGISGEHGGILVLPDDAVPGTPLRDYLGDTVLHVELTPNLAHCLSLAGIAREIAAFGGGTLRERPFSPVVSGAAAGELATVRIADPDLCGRYCAAVVSGVTIGPSPFALQHRLRLAGIRPINNVVDVTNAVMWETGQPLHAFDYDALRGEGGAGRPAIVVRRAAEGEKIRTLDGTERTLKAGALLICDGAGPVALAGVMGGKESEVTDATTRVLLESAHFDRTSIRITAITQRLPSEASLRFGRGVSAAGCAEAARRAAELMRQLAGGAVAPGLVDVHPRPQPERTLVIGPAEVERVLGIQVSAGEMAAVFTALGFGVTPEAAGLRVAVPPFREDVTITADLVEEVARTTGYHRIASAPMSGEFQPPEPSPTLEAEDRTRDILAACGLTEVIPYSLTDPSLAVRLGLEVGPEGFLALANPLSAERTHLRRQLIPGLLETLAANLRFVQRVAIFELARVYHGGGSQLPEEPRRLGILLAGPAGDAWWGRHEGGPFGFFHLKGILETLAARLGTGPLQFEPVEARPFQVGRAASVRRDGAAVGTFGELDPALRGVFDLPDGPVVLGEFDAAGLLAGAGLAAYRRLSRFPVLSQDLALVCPEELAAARVEETLRAAAGEVLLDLRLFDIYRGDQIPAGKKSLAYTLRFQAPDRTLNEDDVAPLRARIIAALAKNLGVTLRA
jgi:phenylalanyl-tRNA synthetase beta chain